MSPALTGGFFTSEPSGKPLELLQLVVMVKGFFLANTGQEESLLNSLLVLRFLFFLSYLNLSYTWNLF